MLLTPWQPVSVCTSTSLLAKRQHDAMSVKRAPSLLPAMHHTNARFYQLGITRETLELF